MAQPNGMPNDAYVRELIETVLESVRRLEQRLETWYERFDRIIRGANGQPGLEEQARRNRAKIEALESRIVTLESDRDFRVHPADVEKTKQARLQTVKEWAGVFGAVLAVILAVVNAIVLLGGNG